MTAPGATVKAISDKTVDGENEHLDSKTAKQTNQKNPPGFWSILHTE